MNPQDLRLCENNCGWWFTPRRPHQRFCSSDCRLEAWAANRKNSSQKPAERVLQEPRRASRNGKGAKVYLQAEEIDALLHLARHLKSYGSGPFEPLRLKLEAAQKRTAPRTLVSGGPPNLNSR